MITDARWIGFSFRPTCAKSICQVFSKQPTADTDLLNENTMHIRKSLHHSHSKQIYHVSSTSCS